MPRVEILTAPQAAALLGFSADTVRTLAEQGCFPGAYRATSGGHWRIPVADVQTFRAEWAQRVVRR